MIKVSLLFRNRVCKPQFFYFLHFESMNSPLVLGFSNHTLESSSYKPRLVPVAGNCPRPRFPQPYMLVLLAYYGDRARHTLHSLKCIQKRPTIHIHIHSSNSYQRVFHSTPFLRLLDTFGCVLDTL